MHILSSVSVKGLKVPHIFSSSPTAPLPPLVSTATLSSDVRHEAARANGILEETLQLARSESAIYA